MFLKGVIDLHIHAAPDVRKRSIDDIGLVNEADAAGVRAIVIKSHIEPTAGRAFIAQKFAQSVKIFGGIVLNPHVGGVNPYAVETAIKMGAKIVWLPTLYSEYQRKREGKSDGVRVVEDNKIVPELKPILEMIAAENIVLATGHSSPADIFTIVEEAKKIGVQKILVNHPESNLVNLSIKDQKLLTEKFGVYFERCYAQPIGGGRYMSNFEINLEAIRQVGYESTIIATDGGQIENPMWINALEEYIGFLYEQGLERAKIDHMTKISPAALLDLEQEKEF